MTEVIKGPRERARRRGMQSIESAASELSSAAREDALNLFGVWWESRSNPELRADSAAAAAVYIAAWRHDVVLTQQRVAEIMGTTTPSIRKRVPEFRVIEGLKVPQSFPTTRRVEGS